MDHPPVCLALDEIELLADGPPRDRDAILVDEPRLAQFLHHHRHTAGLVEILGDILATRLEIDEIGRVLEDLADVIQIKFQPGLVGNRGQVQPGVGRPAGAGHHAGGVFQRLQRDDIAGADVLRDQVHHRLAAGDGIVVARFIGRRSTRGIRQRQTDRL